MTFCYPEKTVSVPNISQFDTTADAWDYAAKVCLRMSQRVLRDPPSGIRSDNKIAEAFYEHFRTLIPHSDSDIRNFEAVHTQRIEERLNNEYNKVNEERRVSRMALSLLYGAVVCSVMSHLLSSIPPIFQDIEIHRKSAYAIYTFYSQLLVDERAKTTWLGWFYIIYDSLRLRPRAAAKRHSKVVKGGSITRKQVKGRKSEVIKKWQDALTYEPFFHAVFKRTGLLTRINVDASADILSRFQKIQFEVYHQERKYEYAWVIHNKIALYGSKDAEYFKEGKKTSVYYRKSKSRWCPIFPSEPLIDVDVEDKEHNKI